MLVLGEDSLKPKESLPAEKEKRPFYHPGWYKDLTNEQYHGSFGFSSSNMKVLCEQTPQHLQAAYEEPEGSTSYMNVGSAVHTMLLEPGKEDDQIFILPTLNLHKPSDREKKEKLEKENKDKIILTDEQMDKALKMVKSVRSKTAAMVILEDNIVSESSVYWWYKNVDENDHTPYKIMAKVRPDILCGGHSVIGDIKTTKDGSYTGFKRELRKYYYHLSAAMYKLGVNQCKPLLEEMGHYAYTNFVFICVENFYPYACSVYELDEKYLYNGEILLRKSANVLHNALTKGWKGYSDEIRVLEPEPWEEKVFIV